MRWDIDFLTWSGIKNFFSNPTWDNRETNIEKRTRLKTDSEPNTKRELYINCRKTKVRDRTKHQTRKLDLEEKKTTIKENQRTKKQKEKKQNRDREQANKESKKERGQKNRGTKLREQLQ